MAQDNMARLPAGIRDAQTADPKLRLEAAHEFSVAGQVDRVFGLFDAVSERDWVDEWDPQSVFPAELSREEGSVFTLERDGRTAVWTVLRYSPVQHVAEYLVTEYDYQHRWIYVSCSAETERTTRVSVRYVTTALTPDGRQDLERYGREYLQAWQEPVQAAVDQARESAS